MAGIFIYVDDNLVLLYIRPDRYDSRTFDIISNICMAQAQGVKFPPEVPSNSELQFSDVQQSFEDSHTCWTCSQQSEKSLLLFDSDHSNITRRGIVQCCFKALQKSCKHTAKCSFEAQVLRLQDSGYIHSLMFDVAEYLTTPKGKGKRKCERKMRPARYLTSTTYLKAWNK